MEKQALTLLFTVSAAFAQTTGSAVPRNEEALRKAIAGLGPKGMRAAPKQVHLDAPPSRACAAPLQAMPIGEGQFPMQVEPGTPVQPMPRVTLPAPPCESNR